MRVKDIMTQNVETARPDETIQAVAERMASGDFGFMPVCEGESIIGAITDRDLAIRAIRQAMPPTTPVSEIMTREVSCVQEDEGVKEAADRMGVEQLRRFPVVDQNNRLVGVVSLGDVAGQIKDRHTGKAFDAITQPEGSTALS